MPSPATTFPIQLNFRFGNFFFQPSSSFTASLLATVNNSSKSSPSVSAANAAGLASAAPLARSLAARATGNAGFKSTAPTLLAFTMWRRSPRGCGRAGPSNAPQRCTVAHEPDQLVELWPGDILAGGGEFDRTLAGVR